MNTITADILVIQCKEPQMSWYRLKFGNHYGDIIMSAMTSQITDIWIVCLTTCSGADQRKHQSSMSLAFVRGIHQWPVDSPHKEPVTRKMFPYDDLFMITALAPEGLTGLEIRTLSKTKIHNLIHNPLHINETFISCIPEDLIDNKASLIHVVVSCII